MSLRMRLFLLLGCLVAALVLAQWWLVRSLTRDVSAEIGNVALRVGEGVAASIPEMRARTGPDGTTAPPANWMPRQPHGTVTERQIFLREVEGRLEIVDERVRVGATGPHVPADAPHANSFVVMLSTDTTREARFLRVGSPDAERHVPIPHAGVEGAVDRFGQHLLAGAGSLLLLGLVVSAVIAHRATAPLRSLRDAARRVGEGELGTQADARAAAEVGETITAFNAMSRQLAALDADARRLREREHLTEVGEIARGLAHGLRNPLHALGLTVEELAAASPEQRELAEAARRQIRRIDQSVRSFLALAASGTTTPAEDVDLGALVQDVALHALQDALGRVSIKVADDGPLPRVRGVPAELRAVAQAIVVNAVEASPDGGRVDVRLEQRPGGLALIVEDEGAGLTESVRERLFTPHLTTKASGSGMGLFLAHRILTTRHGGTLELLSREPRGTRVIATLPAAPDAA